MLPTMLLVGLSDRFRLGYTDLQLASDGCVDHSQGYCVIVTTAPTTIKVTPSTFVFSGMWSRHRILRLLMSESPTEDRPTMRLAMICFYTNNEEMNFEFQVSCNGLRFMSRPLNIVQCIEVPGLVSRPFQGFLGVAGLSQ
ncbi:unnamed protein product [Ilex paraguariensis]|uniref:Uncharacterized protein n=1 Tax=Ilex paraguariensis TaxID=185542 RepID=A0ABC8SXK1_9AQUA